MVHELDIKLSPVMVYGRVYYWVYHVAGFTRHVEYDLPMIRAYPDLATSRMVDIPILSWLYRHDLLGKFIKCG